MLRTHSLFSFLLLLKAMTNRALIFVVITGQSEEDELCLLFLCLLFLIFFDECFFFSAFHWFVHFFFGLELSLLELWCLLLFFLLFFLCFEDSLELLFSSRSE